MEGRMPRKASQKVHEDRKMKNPVQGKMVQGNIKIANKAI
jgi:hypothetical protein